MNLDAETKTHGGQSLLTDVLAVTVLPAPTFDDPTQEILDSIPLGCGLPVYAV